MSNFGFTTKENIEFLQDNRNTVLGVKFSKFIETVKKSM